MREKKFAMWAVATFCFCVLAAGGEPGLEPFSAELLAPFPSDVYTLPDASTRTGLRVHLSAEDLPVETRKALPEELRPEALSFADGFSPAGPMTLVFRQEVDHERLPKDARESVAEKAAIRLFDLTAQKPVPYLVHLPNFNPVGRDPRSFVRLYPFSRLTPGHRYLLFATDSVPLQKKGAKPTRFPLFERLLSGEEPRNEREEKIFARLKPFLPELAKAQVKKEEVIIFTVFTARSDENAIGPLVRAAKALESLPPPGVKVLKVGPVPGQKYFQVEGVITGPAVINEKGELQEEKGELKIQGEMAIPFLLYLPAGAQSSPAPTVVFCEGGPPAKREHARMERVLPELLKNGVALLSIDSPGNRDLNLWKKPTRAKTSFPGTALPAQNRAEMAQWVLDVRTVVSAIAKGQLDILPAKKPDGKSELDPGRIGYTGISYGGINGVLFTVLEPRFSASVIQVGGAQWVALPAEHLAVDLMGESSLYPAGILPGQRPFLLAAAQLIFDLVEPAHYASAYQGNPLLPEGGKVPVLLQCGYHDRQVTTSLNLLAVMGLVVIPTMTEVSPPENAWSEFYGGPLYPNGHVVTGMVKKAREDRLKFLLKYLKAERQ